MEGHVAAGEREFASPWTRGVAILALVYVAVGTTRTSPRPGLHGVGLEVGIALGVFVAGMGALLFLPNAGGRSRVALIVLPVVGSAGLVHMQPNGPGYFGAFPAIACAALMLPAGQSAAVLLLQVAGLTAAWGLTPHPSGRGIFQVDFGVVAIYAISMVARRFREANQEQERLLAELKESRAAAAQAAALGERQRLAREMHDVLAHTLSGLVLNLEGARMLAARNEAGPEVSDAIDRAQRLARTGLAEARRAIGMLRDDELPGPDGLRELATSFQTDSGVPCTLEVTGEPCELSAEARLTLYRVAQEALTNVRKHARPERVAVRLAYGSAATSLSIEDVESGERPSPGDGTGYGLTGMRERAELLGGSLTAAPTEEGFRVELRVPK